MKRQVKFHRAKVNSGANMNIGLILDVDKNSTVNVLVGDNVGNISVRGMANNLRFNMNRTGMMSMNGVYLWIMVPLFPKRFWKEPSRLKRK
jgi:hypothetical protein